MLQKVSSHSRRREPFDDGTLPVVTTQETKIQSEYTYNIYITTQETKIQSEYVLLRKGTTDAIHVLTTCAYNNGTINFNINSGNGTQCRWDRSNQLCVIVQPQVSEIH